MAESPPEYFDLKMLVIQARKRMEWEFGDATSRKKPGKVFEYEAEVDSQFYTRSARVTLHKRFPKGPLEDENHPYDILLVAIKFPRDVKRLEKYMAEYAYIRTRFIMCERRIFSPEFALRHNLVAIRNTSDSRLVRKAVKEIIGNQNGMRDLADRICTRASTTDNGLSSLFASEVGEDMTRDSLLLWMQKGGKASEEL
jgi:hypothetical protein